MNPDHDVRRGDRGRSAAVTRRRLLFASRTAIAILPLAWVVSRVDRDAVFAALRRVGGLPFVAAIGLQLVSTMLGAARWRALLRSYGAVASSIPPIASAFGHYLVGTYYALLPSGLVGDVVRARRTAGAFTGAATPYAVTFVERWFGAVALFVVGAVAAPSARIGASNRVYALAFATSVLGVAFVLVPYFARRSSGAGERLDRTRIGRAYLQFAPTSTHGIAAAFLLSLGTQLATIATIYVLVGPFVEASPTALAAPIALIVLATYVPVTPGAVGQRELAFVALLGPHGVDPSDALAASVATTAVAFAMGGLGGVVHLIERRVAARERESGGAG